MATMEQALAEAYASNPIDEIVYDTLELHHPAFIDDFGNPTAVRVVQAYENLRAYLEDDAPLNPGEEVEFVGLAFSFSKPGFDDDGGVPSLKFTISNVSREITKYLEQAIVQTDSIVIMWRQYLSSDLSGPQMLPVVRMELTSVEASVMSITGTATLATVHNFPFPSKQYTPDDFPGLVR